MSRILAGIVFLSAAMMPDRVAAEKLFDRLRVCSGESAQIIYLSDPVIHTICTPEGRCSSGPIYFYRVQCANGALFDGPLVYVNNPSKSFRGVRVENNSVILSLGIESGRYIEHSLPAGYAPLPVNTKLIENGKIISEIKE